MSVTLSPPIRVFAFVGVLVAVGPRRLPLPGRPRRARRAGDAATPLTKPTPATDDAAPKTPVAPNASTRPARPAAGERLPAPVDRALRRHRVVVVAVYIPGRERRLGACGQRRGPAPHGRARASSQSARSASGSCGRSSPRRACCRIPPSSSEAPRRGHGDAERYRPRDGRSGRRTGAAMSEAAAPGRFRAASSTSGMRAIDGRSVAVLRAIDRGDTCVVEAEVWPKRIASRPSPAPRARTRSRARRGDALRHARGRGADRARLRSSRVLVA